MSEKKTSHEVERIVRRALRHDCVEAQVPKNTVAPSFLNGRSLEPPRLYLELAAWPN